MIARGRSAADQRLVGYPVSVPVFVRGDFIRHLVQEIRQIARAARVKPTGHRIPVPHVVAWKACGRVKPSREFESRPIRSKHCPASTYSVVRDFVFLNV